MALPIIQQKLRRRNWNNAMLMLLGKVSFTKPHLLLQNVALEISPTIVQKITNSNTSIAYCTQLVNNYTRNDLLRKSNVSKRRRYHAILHGCRHQRYSECDWKGFVFLCLHVFQKRVSLWLFQIVTIRKYVSLTNFFCYLGNKDTWASPVMPISVHCQI